MAKVNPNASGKNECVPKSRGYMYQPVRDNPVL